MIQLIRFSIVTCLAAVAQVSFAGPLIYIDDAAGNLGTVDVQTGATTVIGSMGVVMTDIAFAPNGNLFGITFSNLYSINAQTAAVTVIGPLGSSANALVFDTSGLLYAAGAGGLLFSVNTVTGAATSLGNIGFSSAGDLAFNSGKLYMSSTSNELIDISLSTFAGTAVGPIGFSQVFGMATGDNGVLYGVSGTQVFSVNTATGAGTFAVNYAGNGLGSANGTSFQAEAVPEPTSMLFGLGICLTIARTRFRDSRTRPARE